MAKGTARRVKAAQNATGVGTSTGAAIGRVKNVPRGRGGLGALINQARRNKNAAGRRALKRG